MVLIPLLAVPLLCTNELTTLAGATPKRVGQPEIREHVWLVESSVLLIKVHSQLATTRVLLAEVVARGSECLAGSQYSYSTPLSVK